MLTRIEGVLEDVTDGVAEVRIAEGIVYEVLVPACDICLLYTSDAADE